MRRQLRRDLSRELVGQLVSLKGPQNFLASVAARVRSSHTCYAMSHSTSANMRPSSTAITLSIVVPVKTVSPGFADLLRALDDADCEVIVVQAQGSELSGGQYDGLNGNTKWTSAPPSRGGQIAKGIKHSRGDMIWVLHADSTGVGQALAYLKTMAALGKPVWGRFDIRLIGHHFGLVWVARMMNWRSRLTRICTGDQGMFFHRCLLLQAGGFPAQRLMEDIEISKRLRRGGRFSAPGISICTSGERWERSGFWRTIARMWQWRLRYFFGASADQLYDEYYGSQSGELP